MEKRKGLAIQETIDQVLESSMVEYKVTQYAILASQGDVRARRQLIRTSASQIEKIAKTFLHKGAPLSELITEGKLGLMKAVSKFKPGHTKSFTHLAQFWIRRHILRRLSDKHHALSLAARSKNKLSIAKNISQYFK